MEEVSLYRKYRPHNFDNLVGQDHVKITLMNALKSGHVAHAYLFTGPRGTGKTSTARLMAKALNCQNLNDDFDPCNECEFCKEISDGRLIDLIEIDAASNRGIDEVRDLKEKINFAPTRSKVKVYIIDEVHMMTKEAFNALLKTLEEPPSHAYFILATTEVHKIPETIISRCQRFDFKRITTKALMTRLSYIAQLEGIQAEDEALEAISKYVDGGLRDAIGLLEQLTVENMLSFEKVQDVLGISGLSMLENMYDVLMKNQTREALAIINELHVQGSDFRQFSHEFVDLLRNKMLEAISAEKPAEVARLIRMIETFQKAQQRLEADIPQLSLEIAVIELTNNLLEMEAGKEEVAQEKVEEKTIERKHQTIAASKDEPKVEKMNLSLENIQKNWPRVVERIKNPALKNSLKNAKPLELDGVNLVLQFSTIFHKDKVMEPAHRVELENVIKELFDQAVKIMSVVKALEIKAVIEDEPQDDNDKNVVDEALEIFGGQVVE
ncbi:DNA polymerase III subunit gamma/tau [Candidatus Peregrinibacteria bacterium]|nr:DNA polymerase III subunit gamma/tau [Candidatus Peregrinibacteria bacterium]